MKMIIRSTILMRTWRKKIFTQISLFKRHINLHEFGEGGQLDQNFPHSVAPLSWQFTGSGLIGLDGRSVPWLVEQAFKHVIGSATIQRPLMTETSAPGIPMRSSHVYMDVQVACVRKINAWSLHNHCTCHCTYFFCLMACEGKRNWSDIFVETGFTAGLY